MAKNPYSDRSLKERADRDFVLSRFPKAYCIQLNTWTYAIVDELSISRHCNFVWYLTEEDRQTIKFLCKWRCAPHTAWSSAKIRLEKYEQGKFESPFVRVHI